MKASLLSRLPLLSLAGGLTLLLAGIGAPPASAAAQFSVTANGPATLKVGLSGTYDMSIANFGDVAAPVEVLILFSGNLEQTDQITAGGGFDCAVKPPDAGITSAVRCTVQQLVPTHQGGKSAEIDVHARGTAPGAGHLVVIANPDRSVPENTPEPNIYQLDVTIN
jgi:hypothetical protein